MPFSFLVDWDDWNGHHEESFDHKNIAVQRALDLIDSPYTSNIATTYVDEEGHTYLVMEGCK